MFRSTVFDAQLERLKKPRRVAIVALAYFSNYIRIGQQTRETRVERFFGFESNDRTIDRGFVKRDLAGYGNWKAVWKVAELQERISRSLELQSSSSLVKGRRPFDFEVFSNCTKLNRKLLLPSSRNFFPRFTEWLPTSPFILLDSLNFPRWKIKVVTRSDFKSSTLCFNHLMDWRVTTDFEKVKRKSWQKKDASLEA